MKLLLTPGCLSAIALAIGMAGIPNVFAAPEKKQQTGEKEEKSFFRDIRPNHWFWNGSDPIILKRILERIAERGRQAPGEYLDIGPEYGPGEWTYEFEKLGDDYAADAETQEKDRGLAAAASAYYEKASAAYTLAKYPLFRGNQHQLRNYNKSLAALTKAWQLKGFRVETVTMPFEDRSASGYLLLPQGPTPEAGWPFVVSSNGIDVNMGEFFSFAEGLATRGIAFFMYDILGTGFHSEFRLSPDYDRLPRQFIEILGRQGNMDASSVGIIGVSFGGNAAVKLAHTSPDLISASINFCGPVHAAFQIAVEEVDYIEEMYVQTLLDRTHLTGASNEEFLEYMQPFSLIHQGILGQGQQTTVPILSINARGDSVAPTADMQLVSDSSQGGRIIYSGEDDHCPQDRWHVMPQAIEWLVEQLIRNPQTSKRTK